MAEQAYAYVTLIPVAKGFQKAVQNELSGTGKNAGAAASGEYKSGFSTGLKGLATIVGGALAAAGVGTFFKNSISEASDLSESINAVNKAYGDYADDVLALNEGVATRLGLTSVDFNAAAVRFSAFAERVVGEGGDVGGFVDDISTRAADFASVFNIEVSEALGVFQSGLAGEAEPLKRFGINLLDSEVQAYAMANGIGEVGRQLTESEKVQARYGLLMESTSKTAGDFADTSDGLANSQRILSANFKEMQATVGAALVPAFAALTTSMVPVVEELAPVIGQVFTELAPVIEELAGILPGLITSFTPLIPILGQLMGQIVELAGIILPPLVDLFMLIAPVIGEIAVLFGEFLVEAFAQLMPFVSELITALEPLVPVIIDFAGQIFELAMSLLPLLVDLFSQLVPVIIDLLPMFIDFISQAIEPLIPLVFELVEEFMPLIAEIFPLLMDLLMDVLPILMDLALKVLVPLIPLVFDLAREFLPIIEKILPSMIQLLDTLLIPALELLSWTLEYIVIPIVEWVAGIFTDVLGWAVDVVAGIFETFADVVTNVVEAFERDWDNTVKFFEDIKTNIDKMVADITAFFTDFGDKVGEVVDDVIAWFTALPDMIWDAVSDAGTWLVETGKNIIDGLINGITGMAGQLWDAVSGLASDIAEGFADFLGISSPSKVFDEFGQNIGEGLVNGMIAMKDGVAMEAEALARIATMPMEKALKELEGWSVYSGYNPDTAGMAIRADGTLDAGQLTSDFNSVLRYMGATTVDQINQASRDLFGGSFQQVMDALNPNPQATIYNPETGMSRTIGAADEESLALALERAANEGFTNVLDRISTPIDELTKTISDLSETVAREGLTPFANGGLVTGPTRALIGEAGPEVVIPLDRFESMMGLGTGGPGTVVYHAAPNQSLDSEQALFQAMRRAKVVASW